MNERQWEPRAAWSTIACGSLIGLMLAGSGARVVAEPQLDTGVPFEVVVVDLKTNQSGIVSATLVNRLDHSVRDVRLLIRHQWLWNDEMSPGPDVINPGRAVYHTVEGTIPAQGRREFVYRPDPPLRGGAMGSFRTTVEVVGFDEVGD